MRQATCLLLRAAAAATLFVGACRSASPEGSGPAPAPGSGPHPRTARLGIALSLSGPGAPIGLMQQRGVQQAVDEVNAGHLLGRVTLDAMLEDDESDKTKAVALFRRFVASDHVVGIMGPTLSSAAFAADPIGQQAGVPVLGVSNTVGGLTEIGSFVFRDSLSEAQLVPPTVSAVKGRLHLRRAALIYGDDTPTRLAFQSLKKTLQDNHIHTVAAPSYAPGDTDFTPQLVAIRASHPEVLFVVASVGEAAAIVSQARRLGLGNVPIVGGNIFNSAAVRDNAAGAAEGVICGSAWSASSPEPRSQAFVRSFVARWREEPDQFAAQAYAGVYIMVEGLKNARTVSDPRAFRDGLAQVKDVETVLGTFSFTADRNADYPVTVQVVHNGKLAPLADAAAGG